MECDARKTELFRIGGKQGVQKVEFRIHPTDSSFPAKVLPTSHAFFVYSLVFSFIDIAIINIF